MCSSPPLGTVFLLHYYYNTSHLTNHCFTIYYRCLTSVAYLASASLYFLPSICLQVLLKYNVACLKLSWSCWIQNTTFQCLHNYHHWDGVVMWHLITMCNLGYTPILVMQLICTHPTVVLSTYMWLYMYLAGSTSAVAIWTCVTCCMQECAAHCHGKSDEGVCISEPEHLCSTVDLVSRIVYWSELFPVGRASRNEQYVLISAVQIMWWSCDMFPPSLQRRLDTVMQV